MIEFHEQFDHRWCASHHWALIDASWRDELPAPWPVAVVAPAFLGQDTSRCPVLLDLRALPGQAQSTFIDQLLVQASAREDTRASLLLASDHEHATLLAHLADRMAIRVPGESAPKQLRYFDPGTFLELPRLLGERGMSWLLGPFSSALVPWAGSWTKVARPAEAAPHFRLQAAQFQGLSRIGAVNRAGLQLPPPASPAAWIERCRQLDAHVQRGQVTWALSHVHDLIAFAHHAMTHHPAFDSHPLLARLFDQLRTARPEDELDYRELSTRLSAEDWARVVRELPPEQEGPTP